MKNDTKVVLTDEEFLKKATQFANDYNFDFSNYYFVDKIWRKDYEALYGDVPSSVGDSKRKVEVYINANTKNCVPVLSMGDRVVNTYNQQGYYYALEYIPDMNSVVIINYEFNADNRTIEKGDFIFVDSQKRVITKSGRIYRFVDNKNYAKYAEMICHGDCLCDDSKKMYEDSFGKLFPISFSGGNSYTFVRDAWAVGSLIAKDEVRKRSGPKQEKIDELCTLPLLTAELKFGFDRAVHWWEREDVTVQASRANEEYAVLRWFIKHPDTDKAFETARLFVSKKEVMFCRINSFGEFVYVNGRLSVQNFRAGNLIIDDDKVFDGTKLEYFQSCMGELDDDSAKIILLWLFCYYPIAEKMWKTPEYKQIPLTFVSSRTWGKFDEEIKSRYGSFNANGKNICRALGLNAYQAEYIVKHPVKGRCGSDRQPIRMMKEALDLDDISFMDNKTFESFIKYYQHTPDIWRSNRIVYKLNELYPLRTISRILTDLVNNISEENLPHALNHYYDYLDMVTQIDATDIFRPYFRSYEDIVEMHDSVMAIYELKRNAIKQEAFDKRSSKWKKWEYDKNPDFVVVAPVKPDDLAQEGTTLHHCVRSYIDRVANGTTNIMFIRKASDPNTPFFTVEVGNNGTIEQVHGFGNRNVDTEPGLKDFVIEWAKKCKLETRGYNKIR